MKDSIENIELTNYVFSRALDIDSQCSVDQSKREKIWLGSSSFFFHHLDPSLDTFSWFKRRKENRSQITMLTCMLARACDHRIGMADKLSEIARVVSHLSNVLIIVVLSAIFQSFVCAHTHLSSLSRANMNLYFDDDKRKAMTTIR